MIYISIILAVLVLIGIVIFINRMATKDKEQRRKIRQAKQYTIRADDTWDTAEKVSEFIQAADMIDTLMDYYVDLIRRREAMFSMEDSDQLISAAEEFKTTCKNRPVKNELTSDQEINTAKRSFSKASKILRAAVNKKLITGQSYMSMRNALRLRILNLEVQTHERMGDAAGERNNPAIATNHYKFAKKLLIESDLKFEGKNEWVREITKKNQILFGNVVADQLSNGLDNDDPDAVDQHGIPKDLDAIAGKKKRKL